MICLVKALLKVMFLLSIVHTELKDGNPVNVSYTSFQIYTHESDLTNITHKNLTIFIFPNLTQPYKEPPGIGSILYPVSYISIFPSCKNGLIRDKCLEFLCSYGYRKSDSKCIRKTNRIKKVSFHTFLECLMSQSPSMFMEVKNLSITKSFENFMSENYSFIPVNDLNILRVQPIKPLIKLNILELLNDIKNQVKHSTAVTKVYITSNDIHFTALLGFDISSTFPNESLCANTILPDEKDIKLGENCSIHYLNNTYEQGNYVSWIVLKMYKHRYVMQCKVSICQSFYHTVHQSCQLHTIINSYTIRSNMFLNLNDSRREIPPEQYLPLPNGIAYCITSANEHENWKVTIHKIESIITLIGLPISILCYVWITAVFLSNRQMRNVPRYNTVALCISLLFSDVLFILSLFADRHETLCKGIAVLLHWSLLHGYAWGVAIAFEVATKFRSSVAGLRSNRSFKRFSRYIAFSVSVATVIVSISLILNESNTVNFMYGGNGLRWIHNYYASVIGFIIPVAILTLITVTGLLFTVVKIRKEMKNINSVVTRTTGRVSVISKLALKLVIILGVIESIGFIRLTEKEEIFNEIFKFLYTLVRSFRGVLVWSILICTTKNIKKFHKMPCWNKYFRKENENKSLEEPNTLMSSLK